MLLQNFSNWFNGLFTREIKTLKDLFGIDRDVFFDMDQKEDLIILLGTDEATQTYFEMYNLQSPISYAENIPDTFSSIWSLGLKEISIGSTCEWSTGRFPQDYTISELGLVLWHGKYESFEYYPKGTSEITGYETHVENPTGEEYHLEVTDFTANHGSKSYYILSCNCDLVYLKIPQLIKQKTFSYWSDFYHYHADDNIGITFDLFFKNGGRYAVHYASEEDETLTSALKQRVASDYTYVGGYFPDSGTGTFTFDIPTVCQSSPYSYDDLEYFDVYIWVHSVTTYEAYQYVDSLQFRLPFLIGRLSVADGTLNSFTIDRTKSLKLTYEIRAE